jgi:hypothetical protein
MHGLAMFIDFDGIVHLVAVGVFFEMDDGIDREVGQVAAKTA